jgi:hypothetical protein
MQTANRFGGHLLFTEEPEHPTSPVEGVQMYWDSDAHQAFGPTYFATVSLTEEGRGAATVQVCGTLNTSFDPNSVLTTRLKCSALIPALMAVRFHLTVHGSGDFQHAWRPRQVNRRQFITHSSRDSISLLVHSMHAASTVCPIGL